MLLLRYPERQDPIDKSSSPVQLVVQSKLLHSRSCFVACCCCPQPVVYFYPPRRRLSSTPPWRPSHVPVRSRHGPDRAVCHRRTWHSNVDLISGRSWPHWHPDSYNVEMTHENKYPESSANMSFVGQDPCTET